MIVRFWKKLITHIHKLSLQSHFQTGKNLFKPKSEPIITEITVVRELFIFFHLEIDFLFRWILCSIRFVLILFYSINEINRSSRFCFIDFWFTISVKILFISFIMKYLIFVFFSLFHCRLKSDEQKLFVTKKLKIDSTKNIERVMKIKRANVTALLWR